MARPLPHALSPSSVGAFKNCPLAFRFSYLDRLPEPPSAPATKGTLVHRALERLMLRDPAERTLTAALADLDRARQELADHPDITGLELSEADWRAFHADAEALVRRYFDLEDPAAVHPIGLELRLEADVDGVRVRGVIDRLELDAQGELVVTDYKTGAVPSESYEQARLGGVHLYASLCERNFGRLPARVQLLYLSKPEAIIATPTAQSVDGVERRTKALWSAIARACEADDFRPRTGRLCDFCAFKTYCPAFGGDPSAAKELRGPDPPSEPALPLALAT